MKCWIKAKLQKKSNKTKNPNVQKIANHQPLSELFGLVAVTNAEKVILERIQEKQGQINMFEESEDDKDRQANELRNLIGKLPSLSIFIDEVHHAVSDEIKLRAVVTRWAQNHTVNSVIGFSGTPYLDKVEKIKVVDSLSIGTAEITNIVYYYPLIDGVGNFLKRPVVKIADIADSSLIIEKGVREFLDTYKDTVYADGLTAKAFCDKTDFNTTEELIPEEANLLNMPLFNESQTIFYEQIRNSIKMWQQDYNEIYISLGNAYRKNDDYFGSVCKPIAKVLKLYDIYGMDTINGVICGNTILCHCYSPFFSYSENNGEYIKVMSEIGGRYINLFHATTDFQVNNELQFGVQDYGGFIKSPVGNVYSDKFVLMSILCQINFLLYGIEKWINNEIPTKLRFGYLLYYSLISVIEQINQKLGIALKINSKWKSDRFRNSMAHYKLGIVLKESNLIISDAMFGLTEKIFGEDYYTIKKSIYKELEKLAKQIGAYLDLPQRMVYLQ